MNYDDCAVPGLRELLKERGVRGYSRKRRTKLLKMLRHSKPLAALAPQPPPPQLQTWELMRSQHTRPLCPTRPPPLPPSQALLALPSVRFRPDRPRQLQLLRQLEERQPQPQA